MLIVTGIISSCEKFLDTAPSTTVVDSKVFQTVSGAQNVLNGVYRQFKTDRVGGFQFITNWAEMKYQMDVRGNDMVVDAGNQYQGVANDPNNSITGLAHPANNSVWTFFYRRISALNNILLNLPNSEGSQKQRMEIEGQCKVLRAYSYFFLIQYYQQTYQIAKDLPGLPYYNEPSVEGQPREKVSVVYDHIVTDLVDGIDLLSGFSRDAPHQVDQKVAQGLLAQVYLVMGDWSKAADMAKNARQGIQLQTTDEYRGGFQDQNAEWMWTITQREDQNVGLWSNPHGYWLNVDKSVVGIFWLCEDFINLFEQKDARYQFEYRESAGWISYKFREINQNIYPDICMMRAAEMYLIEAEALGKAGSTSQAKIVLNELQNARNATPTDASIDNILIERRKELYGEGFALWDILRNQQGVTHGSDHVHKGSIPAKSWKLIFQVPIGEITTNPAINGETWPNGDQNPNTGIYSGN